MSKRNKAYRHRAEISGVQEGPSGEPSKEHRDTAYGNADERNELSPDQRGETDGYGPRTHDDTRVTRKGE